MRKYTSLPYTEYVVATGNFDKSRKPVDRIVLHHTNGTFKSAIAWFGNPKAGTSAHYIVSNKGEIAAMLEEYYTAYHCGDYPMNQRSIGIETEWYDGMTRTEDLYKKVVELVADICRYYKIPADRSHIIKHSEVKATQCPGTLDVERIVRDVNKLLNGEPTIQVKVSVYEHLVGGATVRKEVAQNLGVEDPDNASTKAIMSAIDAIKKQRDDYKKQLDAEKQKNKDVTAERDELKQKLQQNSNLDQQLLELQEVNKSLQQKLDDFAVNSEGLISQTQHEEEMKKQEKRLKQQFTREIETRVKEEVEEKSLGELFKLFISKIAKNYD